MKVSTNLIETFTRLDMMDDFSKTKNRMKFSKTRNQNLINCRLRLPKLILKICNSSKREHLSDMFFAAFSQEGFYKQITKTWGIFGPANIKAPRLGTSIAAELS